MLHNKHRCSPVNMRKDCSQSLTHNSASNHSVCAQSRQEPPQPRIIRSCTVCSALPVRWLLCLRAAA